MSDCASERNTFSSFTVYLARNAKLTNCLNYGSSVDEATNNGNLHIT